MQFSELHKVRQEEFDENFISATCFHKDNSHHWGGITCCGDKINSFSTQTFLEIAEGEIERLTKEKRDPISYTKENGTWFSDESILGWNAAKDQDIAYWREQIKLIKKQ